MTTCKHADSGCNYPEGECLEVCISAQHTPGPLRRIVGELVPAADGYARRKVRLDCGHEVWCSGAAIYKARCHHCRADHAKATRSASHD